MFQLPEMPKSTADLYTICASITAFRMMFKSAANDLIPPEIRPYFFSVYYYFFARPKSTMTLVIEEKSGMTRNQVYEAAEIYLRPKISPKARVLRVSKTLKQRYFSVTMQNSSKLTDVYGDITLTWKVVCVNPKNKSEKRSFELTFDKKYKDRVLDSYVPYILAKAKEFKQQQRAIRLYCRDRMNLYRYSHKENDEEDEVHGEWGSVNMEHPSTFETIALDPELKRIVLSDLERFLRRKEFYKKVGKAWKRGYLLYGPPGTGKSSLIAAMANYLKFDVFDLDFSNIYKDSQLRETLMSITNRSILVIEDIDCSMPSREADDTDNKYRVQKFTMSGLLNMIDGLWSSCGDERIIIFTTNHKDRLDPALLRPGRMDFHINMSYCTVEGFKVLVSNYLGGSSKDHSLFGEIVSLVATLEVTPAEVAEELMKSDDVGIVFEGLIDFLKGKKKSGSSEVTGDNPESPEIRKSKRRKNKVVADLI